MTTQTIKSTGSKADAPTSHFSLSAWRSKVVKRTFDVVLSGLGLFCLSPVFGLLAFLIKRDSPEPVIYRGMRLGRGGKPFPILKFRTMREEAASYASPPLTAEDDPRITPLGKWLRDTKLNGMPQLWNVLVGEMSIIGPRPLLPEDQPHKFAIRLLVRPGITGWAQVNGGKLLSAEEKQPLDNWYVRNASFLLDVRILFATLGVIFFGERRQRDGASPAVLDSHVDAVFNDRGDAAILYKRAANCHSIDERLDKGRDVA